MSQSRRWTPNTAARVAKPGSKAKWSGLHNFL